MFQGHFREFVEFVFKGVPRGSGPFQIDNRDFKEFQYDYEGLKGSLRH